MGDSQAHAATGMGTRQPGAALHEGIEDLGYGLMLHFGSRYSFGWSRHDHDDGWFVSMDLLGVAVDKQKEVKLWAEDFKESEEALKGFKF